MGLPPFPITSISGKAYLSDLEILRSFDLWLSSASPRLCGEKKPSNDCHKPKLLSFSPRTLTPMRRLLTFLLVSTIMATAQKTPAPAAPNNAFPTTDELNQMAARFAPAPLEVDLSGLSAGDKKALAKLIEAGRIVNHLFMQQFWSGDLALYDKLQLDKSPLGKARLHYFWINKGPWSDLDGHAAFLPGVPPK